MSLITERFKAHRLFNQGRFPFTLVYTRPPTKRAFANHLKRYTPNVIRNKWDVYVVCRTRDDLEVKDLILKWETLVAGNPAVRSCLKLPNKALRLLLEAEGFRIDMPWSGRCADPKVNLCCEILQPIRLNGVVIGGIDVG